MKPTTDEEKPAMHEIVNIKHAICIVHFAQDALIPHRRVICYQVYIDATKTSPSGQYIRFESNHKDEDKRSEIHGWVRVDDLVIDEILENLEEESDKDSVGLQSTQPENKAVNE